MRHSGPRGAHPRIVLSCPGGGGGVAGFGFLAPRTNLAAALLRYTTPRQVDFSKIAGGNRGRKRN